MRIAWFSILSEEGSKTASASAYLSGKLLPFISQAHNLHLFHDSFKQHQNYRTDHYLSFHSIHRQDPFDICLYQIEDLPGAYFSRMFSGLYPGLTVFHELYFRNRNAISVACEDPFYDEHFPRRELSRAGIPVFMNVAAKNEYDRQYKYIPSLKSYLLNYPADYIADSVDCVGEALTVGFIGDTSAQLRCHKMLAAVNKFAGKVRLVWITNEAEEAKKLANDNGITNYEIINNLSPADFQKVLPGIDAVFHLKSNYYDRLGPFKEISFAYGKPYVTMNRAEGEDLSSRLVIKIEPGNAEASQLAECLRELIKLKNEGRYANCFFREESENLSSKAVSDQLLQVIEEAGPYLRMLNDKLDNVKLQAYNSVREEFVQDIKKHAPAAVKPLLTVNQSSVKDAKQLKNIDYRNLWKELF